MVTKVREAEKNIGILDGGESDYSNTISIVKNSMVCCSDAGRPDLLHHTQHATSLSVSNPGAYSESNSSNFSWVDRYIPSSVVVPLEPTCCKVDSPPSIDSYERRT
nr:hypothetical protein [Tanacetum cinerariifolium]